MGVPLVVGADCCGAERLVVDSLAATELLLDLRVEPTSLRKRDDIYDMLTARCRRRSGEASELARPGRAERQSRSSVALEVERASPGGL